MLLAIDIGNTNITIGVFKIDMGHALKKPLKIWRLSTNKDTTIDEYGTKIMDLFHYALIGPSDVQGVAIASVVPCLNNIFKDVSISYFKKKPYFISTDIPLPMKILYKNVSEIGADRIANSVAALEFFGAPCLVIDFGTATTFDCINKKGEYIGGVIAPGPNIAAEALFRKTSKLPFVEIVKPPRVVGSSTIEGIQSGIYFGYVGLIKEIIKMIQKEMSEKLNNIISTGGLAKLIVSDIPEIKRFIPELTLEGIRIIWEKRNRQIVDNVDKSVNNL